MTAHHSQTTTATPPRHAGVAVHLSRIAFAFGAVLFSIVAWLSRTWASLSTDEILFHLRAPLSGTNTTVIREYVLRYFSVVVVACAIVFWALGRTWRKSERHRKVGAAATALLGVALVAGALWNFNRMVDLAAFLPNGGEDFIGEHYVDPAKTEVTFPERKRNLVYVFLESMELTYADETQGGAWGENLIPELCDLAHEGETFAGDSEKLNGALVLPGCTWTMGGLFAQSSGVPLKVPTQGNQSWIALDDFFPELRCLGNLLADQGYRQYALFGSDSEFGNRKEYYHEHGDFDVFDHPRAIEEGFIPADYNVWWGFEDEKLFAKARETLTEAAKGDEPFNLTLLTVDTHFEDGYVCRLCGTEHGDDQYANVMSCSSRQVYDFVRWIQAQDFYEDTTIVLCGDHTTMDKDFCDDVPESYQRRTYTTIINGAATPEDPDARREYATIDLFPTTLAALGCTIEGDRLGLGTNLYGTTQTIVEEYGLPTVTRKFNRQSEFLNSYSNAPKGKELVDRVLAEFQPELVYRRKKRHNSFFILKEVHHFSLEVVEDARLEVTDTRTGETKSYPMDVYRSNKNQSTKYFLRTRFYIPEDEMQYYTATAYMTIEGDVERAYDTWDGVKDADS